MQAYIDWNSKEGVFALNRHPDYRSFRTTYAWKDKNNLQPSPSSAQVYSNLLVQ